MARPKDPVLEQCGKATLLCNKVSVHMLEYLSTVTDRPFGFDQLAQDFLDICRVLFAIEAGLNEAFRSSRKFPPKMMTELERKFRGAHTDFQHLDKMIANLLEYENKGTMGRIQKGLRKMFPGHEIEKMRGALAKTREAFEMSAMVFKWSLGDATIDDSVGIGYTGLEAALERMRGNRPPPTPQKQAEQTVVGMPPSTADIPLDEDIAPTALHGLPPVLPPIRSTMTPERGSPRELHIKPDVRRLPDIQRHPSMSTHSVSSHGNHPRERVTSFALEELAGPQLPRIHSGSSTDDTLVMDMTHLSVDPLDLKPKVVRHKADPFTMPRWTPRNTAAANATNMKTALVTAVRSSNHTLIEQLLDRGVAADTGPETHVLNDAVLHQDVESMRLLLLFGADPNLADKHGMTPLLVATDESFTEGATTLLKYGADPNLGAGPDQMSPLASAVLSSKTPLVQLLLSYGGDSGQQLPDGNTLLVGSITKIVPKQLIDLLLAYGANPDAKSNDGETPLFRAIQAARVDIVLALLDANANPNLPGPKHMLWPSTWHPQILQAMFARGADWKKASGIMELATSINKIESIRVMIKAGVDPNMKKDGVYTPLCSAIRDDRPDIFDLLLSSGADPNVMASEYPAWKCVTHRRVKYLPALVAAGADLHKPKGILEMAVQTGNVEALNWLLDAGVNPNDRNEAGHTPLTTAIREQRVDMIDLLLARGADANQRGQDWPVCMAVKAPAILAKLLPAVQDVRAHKGVLEMAVMADQLESMKLLLAAGVSVEDKNGGVFSPLTTALREDRKELVRYLLYEAGADPNAPGEHLPIIKAIRRFRDDLGFIEMLLDRGADINKTYRGWNAIMQAVENGEPRVLKLLVERGGGVDLEAQDDAGRTVAQIVASTGWETARELLLPGKAA